MKNTRQKINNKGFTLVEVIAVMAVATVILGAVLPAVIGAINNSKVTSTINTIKSLQAASVSYYNSNGGTYASTGTIGVLSLANLASNGMLPAGVTGTDAWGGAITVAPDATAGQFDITMTKVPTSAQTPLATALGNLIQSTPTLTSGSWVGVF